MSTEIVQPRPPSQASKKNHLNAKAASSPLHTGTLIPLFLPIDQIRLLETFARKPAPVAGQPFRGIVPAATTSTKLWEAIRGGNGEVFRDQLSKDSCKAAAPDQRCVSSRGGATPTGSPVPCIRKVAVSADTLVSREFHDNCKMELTRRLTAIFQVKLRAQQRLYQKVLMRRRNAGQRSEDAAIDIAKDQHDALVEQDQAMQQLENELLQQNLEMLSESLAAALAPPLPALSAAEDTASSYWPPSGRQSVVSIKTQSRAGAKDVSRLSPIAPTAWVPPQPPSTARPAHTRAPLVALTSTGEEVSWSGAGGFMLGRPPGTAGPGQASNTVTPSLFPQSRTGFSATAPTSMLDAEQNVSKSRQLQRRRQRNKAAPFAPEERIILAKDALRRSLANRSKIGSVRITENVVELKAKEKEGGPGENRESEEDTFSSDGFAFDRTRSGTPHRQPVAQPDPRHIGGGGIFSALKAWVILAGHSRILKPGVTEATPGDPRRLASFYESPGPTSPTGQSNKVPKELIFDAHQEQSEVFSPNESEEDDGLEAATKAAARFVSISQKQSSTLPNLSGRLPAPPPASTSLGAFKGAGGKRGPPGGSFFNMRAHQHQSFDAKAIIPINMIRAQAEAAIAQAKSRQNVLDERAEAAAFREATLESAKGFDLKLESGKRTSLRNEPLVLPAVLRLQAQAVSERTTVKTPEKPTEETQKEKALKSVKGPIFPSVLGKKAAPTAEAQKTQIKAIPTKPKESTKPAKKKSVKMVDADARLNGKDDEARDVHRVSPQRTPLDGRETPQRHRMILEEAKAKEEEEARQQRLERDKADTLVPPLGLVDPGPFHKKSTAPYARQVSIAIQEKEPSERSSKPVLGFREAHREGRTHEPHQVAPPPSALKQPLVLSTEKSSVHEAEVSLSSITVEKTSPAPPTSVVPSQQHQNENATPTTSFSAAASKSPAKPRVVPVTVPPDSSPEVTPVKEAIMAPNMQKSTEDTSKQKDDHAAGTVLAPWKEEKLSPEALAAAAARRKRQEMEEKLKEQRAKLQETLKGAAARLSLANAAVDALHATPEQVAFAEAQSLKIAQTSSTLDEEDRERISSSGTQQVQSPVLLIGEIQAALTIKSPKSPTPPVASPKTDAMASPKTATVVESPKKVGFVVKETWTAFSDSTDETDRQTTDGSELNPAVQMQLSSSGDALPRKLSSYVIARQKMAEPVGVFEGTPISSRSSKIDNSTTEQKIEAERIAREEAEKMEASQRMDEERRADRRAKILAGVRELRRSTLTAQTMAMHLKAQKAKTGEDPEDEPSAEDTSSEDEDNPLQDATDQPRTVDLISKIQFEPAVLPEDTETEKGERPQRRKPKKSKKKRKGVHEFDADSLYEEPGTLSSLSTNLNLRRFSTIEDVVDDGNRDVQRRMLPEEHPLGKVHAKVSENLLLVKDKVSINQSMTAKKAKELFELLSRGDIPVYNVKKEDLKDADGAAANKNISEAQAMAISLRLYNYSVMESNIEEILYDEELLAELPKEQAKRDEVRDRLAVLSNELKKIEGEIKQLAQGSEEEKQKIVHGWINNPEDDVDSGPSTPTQSSFDPTMAESQKNIDFLRQLANIGNASNYRDREYRSMGVQTDASLSDQGLGGGIDDVSASVKKSTDQLILSVYTNEKLLFQTLRNLTVAVANVSEFFSILEVDLSCKQCLKTFVQPRSLLGCGHAFCAPCLHSMYIGLEAIQCAECQRVSHLGYAQNPTVEAIVIQWQSRQLIKEVGVMKELQALRKAIQHAEDDVHYVYGNVSGAANLGRSIASAEVSSGSAFTRKMDLKKLDDDYDINNIRDIIIQARIMVDEADLRNGM